ncbi:MAG: hypothetical protein EXR46_00215 [Dehalococcoidia bacterium]|nr:hypothetical protein [Dehalococcoidia bacterium]
MSGLHLSMMVVGAVLAVAGLAVALPTAWRHRVREPAGAAGKLERCVPYALLTFVAGVALVALPFLLPFPPGSGVTASPTPPAAVPTAPVLLPTGVAPTIRPTAPANTAQPAPSATPVRPTASAQPTGLPAATTPPPPSAAPSPGDISGRWNHAGGSVELQTIAPDRFSFRGFDTQGRLLAEGTTVRNGNALTLTGTAPGLGLPLTGEFQVISATRIQGELRNPLGNFPLVLTR